MRHGVEMSCGDTTPCVPQAAQARNGQGRLRLKIAAAAAAFLGSFQPEIVT
jgi:hypothetical protein